MAKFNEIIQPPTRVSLADGAWTHWFDKVTDALQRMRDLDGILTKTATLDFGSIAAGAQGDLAITVVGAKAGDTVVLGLPAAPTAGIVFNAFVSTNDTVTVRATNITAGAIDPVSASYRVTVMEY